MARGGGSELGSRVAVTASPDLLLLVAIALVSFVVTYLGTTVGLVLGHLRLALLVAWIGPIAGAATSLAVSSVGALVGAIRHAQGRRVELRLLLSLGAPSAAGAFATASLAPRVDPWWIKMVIAATLVASGASMLRRSLAGAAATGAPTVAEAPRSGARPLVIEAIVGALFGALSGLVGLLLGTLRLPILLRLAQSPPAAVGTNMAIGAVTGLVAGVAALREGSVHPRAFAVLAPVTVVAAFLGARATGSLRREALERLIAVILIGTGVMMAIQLAG